MRYTLGSQATSAVLRLRQLILDGELRAGEHLNEQQLAARLGTSRTPLRLALAQFQNCRLAEPAAMGGLVLRSFNSGQVKDVIDLRGLLEATAARLAAERGLGSATLAQLHRCLENLERAAVRATTTYANGSSSYATLNADLHAELFTVAGSEVLSDAYEQLLAVPFASPSAFLFVRPSEADVSAMAAARQRQHRLIVDAINRGDGEAAERLMRRHALTAVEDFDRALDADTDALENLPGRSLIVLD
jgi:GntR family transcriptional regulator, vanillate catabolism transcriptional regulator